MTEQEWLACTDPAPMLDFLRGKVSDRKLRLFAVACCRRIQHLLEDERSRLAVDVAERFADGRAGEDERHRAAADAYRARNRSWDDDAMAAAYYAGGLNSPANSPDAEWGMVVEAAGCVLSALSQHSPAGATDEARGAEREYQSMLLRDIFGPLPFRPVPVNPGWLTLTVKHLADAIYDERTFDRLPILADALEDAGCSSHDVLDHCRQPGEHYRGCWVIDLLLAKE